jgi:HK97 family phage prohead protease
MSNLTSIEQFRRRLKGIHRVHWSASDVGRIGKRFGLVQRDIHPAVAAFPTRVIPRANGNLGNEIDFTATISTAAVDRMGDCITVSGWRLQEYRSNPIVFFNHFSAELPIGRSSVWIAGAKLKAGVKLASPAANPLAQQVHELIDGGFLSAVSVGFIPTRWQFSKDPARPLGIDFLEQTLLEFSICGIPANPAATIDAIRVPTNAGKTSQSEAVLRRERELAELRRGPLR